MERRLGGTNRAWYLGSSRPPCHLLPRLAGRHHHCHRHHQQQQVIIINIAVIITMMVIVFIKISESTFRVGKCQRYRKNIPVKFLEGHLHHQNQYDHHGNQACHLSPALPNTSLYHHFHQRPHIILISTNQDLLVMIILRF